MFTNTLGFHIYTTKYLGKPQVVRYIIECLRGIPKAYLPTKAEVNSSNNKEKFSFDTIDSIIEKVAIENLYGGYIRLYKIKRIFDMYVNWSRGPLDMLNEEPNRKFNNISVYIENGLDLVNNQKDFSIFREIWVNLCEKFEAVYGQCLLYDSKSNSNSYLGWGFGICISRLHWQTYFGKPYIGVLNFNQEIIKECCTIETCASGATILNLNENPLNLTLRSDIECKVVNALGAEFFWIESDNRLKPRYQYRMPELDLSEIIYEPN